jgi:hypothetical protein
VFRFGRPDHITSAFRPMGISFESLRDGFKKGTAKARGRAFAGLFAVD